MSEKIQISIEAENQSVSDVVAVRVGSVAMHGAESPDRFDAMFGEEDPGWTPEDAAVRPPQPELTSQQLSKQASDERFAKNADLSRLARESNSKYQ